MPSIHIIPDEHRFGRVETFSLHPVDGELTELRRPLQISIIAAIAPDGAIGRRGDLLWHIPEDLKHFKTITSGHTVIMGRKTYQSLPRRPLPKRRNIVITGNATFNCDGAERCSSLEEALSAATPDGEAFIIGGESIYRQALPFATCLYLTHIEATAPDADTFFPEIDPNCWRRVTLSDPMRTADGITFRFATYVRTSPTSANADEDRSRQ